MDVKNLDDFEGDITMTVKRKKTLIISNALSYPLIKCNDLHLGSGT